MPSKGKKTKSSGKQRSFLEGESSLSRLSERKAVFNSLGNPMSWRLPVPSPTQEFWAVTTWESIAYLTTSNSTEIDLGRSFSISDMNAAELAGFQALFDQYRIRWIELMLVPRASGAVVTGSNLGRLCTAIDYDSSSPVTFANLETFTNSQTTSGGVAHYRAFTPCCTILAGTFGGSSGSAVVSVRSPWLDLAVTNTPHYGLKVCSSSTDSAYISDLIVRFHLAFRQKI